MSLDQIDFTPLENVQNAWKLAFIQVVLKRSPIKRGLLIALIIFLVIMVYVLPGLGGFGLAIFFTLIYDKVVKIKANSWQRFAEANHWPIGDADLHAHILPPGLKNIGNNQVTSQVINARLGDTTCDLLSYQFTRGSSKYDHNYYFTIARISLPAQFPHIILDNRKKWGIRSIPRDYENIRLEGNFDKYFKLYEAVGQQVDVLSIITPDVMQTLLSSDQQQDIEISGNSLYFIGVHDQRVPTAMRSLLQSVQALSTQIMERAKTYGASAQAKNL